MERLLMGTTASKKFFLSLSQNPNSFDSSRYKKGGEREKILIGRDREREKTEDEF